MVWSLERIAILVVPVSAALVAVALPAMRLVSFGRAEHSGPGLIAAGLASLAIGLLPYAALLLFARAFYALGDSRTPAIVAIGSALAGVATIAVASPLAHGTVRVAVIGAGHTAAYALGALVLGVMLARRLDRRLFPRRAAVAFLWAAPLAAVIWAVLDAIDPTSRGAIVALLVVLGGAASACYVLAVRRSWRAGRLEGA